MTTPRRSGTERIQRRARARPRGVLRAALSLAAVLVLAACGGGGGGGDAGIPPFDAAAGVVVHDLDGDGLMDVAVAVAHVAGPPPHAGAVKVWLQRSGAQAAFLPAARYAAGPDPTVLRVADVDADGVPDLVAMSSHASAVDGAPLVDEVTVLRGDPAQRGRFLGGTTLRAGARLSDIAAADFDGDGLPDIAFSSHGLAARVGVWWGDAAAPGRFGAPATLVDGAAAALAAADLDGDGRTDLAFVAANAARALLRDPAAARVFRPPLSLAEEPLPTCLTAVDLDRDGRSDLVLGSRSSTDFGASGALQTLRNDAALPARFVPLQRLALVRGSWHCIAADFDGDGWPDLATTGGGWGGDLLDDIVEVLLADPAPPGRLQPPVQTVTDDTSSGLYLAAGDLDGDGRPEVAIPFQGGVLILRQDPARPGTLLRGSALP